MATAQSRSGGHLRRGRGRAGPDPQRPPPRPAGGGHHAGRGRHGGPRVGAGLPPRPPAARGPTQRLGPGLVRRLPRLPVLHGGPEPGDRRPRRGPALRRGLQARLRVGRAGPAGRRLGLRPPGPGAVPGAGAARRGRRRVPLRALVHHLRRQRGVDPGGGVRLLHQPLPGRRLPRARAPGARDRSAPGGGGGGPRAVRPVPRDPPALRPRRCRRGVGHAPGTGPVALAGPGAPGRRCAERLLDHPLRPAPGLPQRHGVGEDHHLRRAPAARPPGGGGLPPARGGGGLRRGHPSRRRPHRGGGAGAHGGHRLGAAAPAARALPRRHRPGVRRGLRPGAAGTALERPPPALLVPVPLPAGRAGRGRARRGPGHAGGQGTGGALPGRRHRRRRGGRPHRPGRRGPAPAAAAPRPGQLRRQPLHVARPHHHRPQLRAGLGPLELHGLRAQGRLARVPRADGDDVRRGAHRGVRPGHVGVRARARPLRHTDGADAAAVLDRRLHRLDGGPLLRGVGHHAVPLHQPDRAVGRALAGPAGPALRLPRHLPRRRPPPALRRPLLPRLLADGGGGRRCRAAAPVGRPVGPVARLRGGRRRARAAARQPARRARGRARGRQGVDRRGDALVPLAGALGRVPGRRRPVLLAPGGRGRGPGRAVHPPGGGVGRGHGHRPHLVHGRSPRHPRSGEDLLLPELGGVGGRRAVAGGPQPDGGRAHRHPRGADLRDHRRRPRRVAGDRPRRARCDRAGAAGPGAHARAAPRPSPPADDDDGDEEAGDGADEDEPAPPPPPREPAPTG